MKSAKRHQLQTNVLADRAGHAIEQARPYTRWIFLGVLGFIAAAIAVGYWVSHSAKLTSDSWRRFYFASGDPDELMQVYQESPNAAASLWAKQGEGNANLSQALRLVYTDRKQAEDLLDQAKANFDDVAANAKDNLLLSRALFGLAQTLEARSDIEGAIAEYKKMLKVPGLESSLAKNVESHVAWLESDSGKSFNQWYKDFRPEPAKPLDIKPEGDVPANPDMTMPDLPEAIPTNELKQEESQEKTTGDVKSSFVAPPLEKDASKDEEPSSSEPASEPAKGEGDAPSGDTKPASGEGGTQESTGSGEVPGQRG